MIIEGVVGPRTVADGTPIEMRLGRTAEQIVADAHGRYAEAARRGKVFVGANAAAQAVSVALATTYTGLNIFNPNGSGKNLEILAAMFALSVAPAAIASLHLIGGYAAADPTGLTAITGYPRSLLLGPTSQSVAKVNTAATIATPLYLLPLAHGFTAAALPGGPMPWVDLGGLIVVPPGGFLCIGALTAVTGFGGIVWEETDA